MPQPILIIAPETTAQRAAEALRTELDKKLELAPNRRSGLALLRRNEYSLVLLDETLAAADPDAADTIYQNAGAASVLELNFAITGTPRIVRQVRSTLTRRSHDQQQARQAAVLALQNELSALLAGLLLESQLALRDATATQAPKLRHLVELAGDLRDRLRAQ
ncbi:MAG: hypothetical protein PW792_13380 [Acidobacteriaceae bacterium]|nr:hypothetical protein [Acidobacteriaceae bacterium]